MLGLLSLLLHLSQVLLTLCLRLPLPLALALLTLFLNSSFPLALLKYSISDTFRASHSRHAARQCHKMVRRK